MNSRDFQSSFSVSGEEISLGSLDPGSPPSPSPASFLKGSPCFNRGGISSNSNSWGVASKIPWWIDSFNLEYFFLSRREYENLIDEVIYQYSMSKKKLQRKREALLVVAKDLEACMKEREQLISVLRKYMENCECSATTIAKVTDPYGSCSNVGQTAVFGQGGFNNSSTQQGENSKSSSTLRNAVDELIYQRNSLRQEIESLRNRLNDANEDIKLLRETVARQRFGATTHRDNSDSCQKLPVWNSNQSQQLEEVLSQLEFEKQKGVELEIELSNYKDLARQLKAEKNFFLQRSERLNKELNYLLCGNSDKSIVDIDALTLENKYLKQQLAQVTSEKAVLKEQHSKLKENFAQQVTARNSSSTVLKRMFVLSSGSKQTLQSLKQVREYLTGTSKTGLPVTQQFVEDIHSLAMALTESLDDKMVALTHQKCTNKALGLRVRELEQKVKTLEGSGLWGTKKRDQRLEALRRELKIGTLASKTLSTDCVKSTRSNFLRSCIRKETLSRDTELSDYATLDETNYCISPFPLLEALSMEGFGSSKSETVPNCNLDISPLRKVVVDANTFKSLQPNLEPEMISKNQESEDFDRNEMRVSLHEEIEDAGCDDHELETCTESCHSFDISLSEIAIPNVAGEGFADLSTELQQPEFDGSVDVTVH